MVMTLRVGPAPFLLFFLFPFKGEPGAPPTGLTGRFPPEDLPGALPDIEEIGFSNRSARANFCDWLTQLGEVSPGNFRQLGEIPPWARCHQSDCRPSTEDLSASEIPFTFNRRAKSPILLNLSSNHIGHIYISLTHLHNCGVLLTFSLISPLNMFLLVPMS